MRSRPNRMDAAVNPVHFVANRSFRVLAIVIAFLIVVPTSGQPTTRRLARANPRERHQQTIGFHTPSAAIWQFAEDFDRDVKWEQKQNHGTAQKTDYGYSGTNHLGTAGCAPGEIGGTGCGEGISWFADCVCRGSTALNAEIPL